MSHLQQKRSTTRTQLQSEADSADSDVFNLICRLERMYEAARRSDNAQEKIHRALELLRATRPHLRSLMSNDDRART